MSLCLYGFWLGGTREPHHDHTRIEWRLEKSKDGLPTQTPDGKQMLKYFRVNCPLSSVHCPVWSEVI